MTTNYFNTLTEALKAEGVNEYWPGTPVEYGQTVQVHVDDGSRYGRVISVYRHNDTGRYERPVTYRC
jgi:hypothetical protein